MDLIDGISNLSNFGIDLKLDSVEAETFYCEALRLWFQENKGYVAIPESDREFTLTIGMEEVALVFIYDSVLRIKPIDDEPYEVLICILEFIAENHQKTIDVYNYLEDTGQEILGWPKDDLYSPNEDIKETDETESGSKETDEEEESDEWI